MTPSRQRIVLLLGIIAGGLLPGCLEIETRTRVNADGTVLRTQVLTGDSTEVEEGAFPFPVDSTWTFSLARTEKGEFRRMAEKLFRNVEELNRDADDTSRLNVRSRTVVQKRFLWFFTEYTYRETYLRSNPFNAVPLTDYVPQELVDRYLRGELPDKQFASRGDSLALHDAGMRFQEWQQRGAFEAYYAELAKGVEALHDRILTDSMLAAHKEELFGRTRDWILGSGNMDTLAIIVGHALNSRRIPEAEALNREGFAGYRTKAAFVEYLHAHPYTARIEMPGLVLDTNAPSIEGNELSWKDVLNYAYLSDYDVWAKSRTVNWWAVIASGCVVLAAMLLFIGVAFRRRRAAVL